MLFIGAPMAAITTRETAGTGATIAGVPLTNAQIDQNFININTELVGKAEYPLQTGNSGKYLTTNGTVVSWAEVVLPSGQTAGSATAGYLQYSGTTKTDGQLYGGTDAPSNTTRLNFDGHLYATKFFGDGSGLTSVTAVNLTGGSNGALPYKQVEGVGAYSVAFDGNADYLSIPSGISANLFTGDFTIECWFRASVIPSGVYPSTLLYNVSGSTGFTLRITPSSQGLVEFVGLRSFGSIAIQSTTVITANTWYHVAVSRSGSNLRLFLNGVQEAIDTTGLSIVNSSAPLYIGSDGGTDAFNGYISSARIIKTTAQYTSNFTPTAPLTAVANTALLTCRYSTLIDGSTNNYSVSSFDNASVTGSTYPSNIAVTDTLQFLSIGTAGKFLKSNGTLPVWDDAGATITDDTTSNATRYLLFDDVTTGSATSIGTSSTKLTFNPSTGTFNTVNIAIQGTNIINSTRTIQNYGVTHNALGSGSGTRDINLQNGNFVSATVAGATTFTFSNPLASPHACGFVLELTNGGSASVIWPTSIRWPKGTAPALTGSGVDVLAFFTDDGGTNWRGVLSMSDSKATV